MTAYEILSHDIERITAEYEDCKEEVADCAAQIANGDFCYCSSIKSAIRKMEDKKIQLDNLKSALSILKNNQ